MPFGKIKIVVAGGQPLFRHGIRATIVPHSDMEMIGEIEENCVKAGEFKQLKPDVIIIDGLLPGSTKRECATRIKAVHPAKYSVGNSKV